MLANLLRGMDLSPVWSGPESEAQSLVTLPQYKKKPGLVFQLELFVRRKT